MTSPSGSFLARWGAYADAIPRHRDGRSTAAAAILVCLLPAWQFAAAAEDLELLEQQALRAAVDRVAASVVRIETIGGLERVDNVLFGTGPTSGLVIGEDGYIISSALSFYQRPASILVQFPDGTRKPAKLVATDHNRMVVLLKVEVDQPLAVGEIVPADQMRVGQWTIAVGRTFEGNQPNVSVGILSALNRIWGKAIQTDAAVSPNNYGGPLVDIQGRVLGVLVPLSPEQTDEVAGVQWYDSGIGFAVTLDDLPKILPKLKRGEDLYAGVIGVSFGAGSLYTADPVIAAVRLNSPAKAAGLQQGDRIVEINGRQTVRAAEVKEEISRRYAGETIRVVVLRDQKRIERQVELVAKLEPYECPFLGVLPMRSLPSEGDGGDASNGRKDSGKAPPGVAVRYVYRDSPAAEAGIEPGDVLTSLDGEPIRDDDQLRLRVSDHQPQQQVKLEVRRGKARLTFAVKLGRLPEDLPAEPLPPAREPGQPSQAQRPQVGKLRLKIPEFENDAWAYVPADYDPAVPHGVVVWLHPPGSVDAEELIARWKRHCDRDRLILLAPISANPDKWQTSELAVVAKLLDQIDSTYNVDPMRIVAHGQQGGGTLAYLLAFRNRELVRAVAAVDAPLAGRPPENEPVHRLAFYVANADKSRFARRIEGDVARLRDMNYPVTVKPLGEQPRYLDEKELSELVRWIDTLDRI